jgi:hypothetical protein
LGSLNASHASAQAFGHAASPSVVGQLAAYATALNSYATALANNQPAQAQQALAAAAQALANAANNTLSASVVTAVNGNLVAGGVLSGSAAAAANQAAGTIAGMANADR